MPHDRAADERSRPRCGRSSGATTSSRASPTPAERGCCGVVISAAAGAGKTRLGREALAAAERDGAMTPVGAGDDVRPDDPARRLRRFAARRCARGRAARVAARERAGAARSCARTSDRAGRRRCAAAGPGLGDPGVAPGDQRGRLRRRNGACRRAVARRDRVAVEGRRRVPPAARPAQRRGGADTGRDGARWSVGGDGDSLGGGSQPGQPAVRARARARRRRHGRPEALARSMAALGTDCRWAHR